jgi:hypothetical protein
VFRDSDETGSQLPLDRQGRRVGTVVALDLVRPPAPFPTVFERVFPELSALHASFRNDGVLMAAAWNGAALTEYLHLPLGSEPEFAVIGRHDRCDFSLGRDPSLSLRHLLLAARAAGGEVRLRLLDLQTGGGFFTEDGRRCEALTADGPMFVRAGGYHLFLLPTGSLCPLAWANKSSDAWAMIPERVYRDSRIPQRGAAPPLALVPDKPRVRRTVITQIVHPPGLLRRFSPAVGARGAPVAEVELAGSGASERFTVHEAEVERGLLIGRYERCQVETQDDKISRVHLLVIRDGEDVWAVDTASSNGTTAAGQRVRRLRLNAETQLLLAQEVTLRWNAADPRQA